MLPYAFLRPVRLRCPHCGGVEVRLRAAAVPGARHACPHCKKSYALKSQPRRSSLQK
ncbi:MAG TPA: hypothetical protein RMH99_05645 [Sandaracinaceae bacterium LLY-WYZ-13_1]|nr:hypothetical protein [Sandaracinaceae bacterium LLY-WYZ-13_1]